MSEPDNLQKRLGAAIGRAFRTSDRKERAIEAVAAAVYSIMSELRDERDELAEALEECRVACCEIAVGAQAAGHSRTSPIGAAWSFEFAARRLLDAAEKADTALARAKGEADD